ncbi:MAG: ABC transporter permease [Acidimicrobiales bacterium]
MTLVLIPRNPVVVREVKERLRTRRATVVVTLYLVVLVAVLQLVYQAFSVGDSLSRPNPTAAAELGRTMFETLLFVMAVLVCFIVPGLTADAVAGERERQTLVPLQVSLLTPRSLLFGKLVASVAFATLLVVATLPLLGVSFVVGGVSVGAVLRGVAAVAAVGLVLACLALACSAFSRRTQSAVVVAYAVTLALTVGTLAVYGGQVVLGRARQGPPPLTVLALNPFMGLADVTGAATDGPGLDATSPLAPLRSLIREREGNRALEAEAAPGPAVLRGPMELDSPVFVDPGPSRPRPRSWIERVPFWARNAAALGALSAVAFALAARRLRTPTARTGP